MCRLLLVGSVSHRYVVYPHVLLSDQLPVLGRSSEERIRARRPSTPTRSLSGTRRSATSANPSWSRIGKRRRACSQ